MRNATLDDLATMLRDQQARKVDVVAPAKAISSNEGMVHIKGAEPILTPDGVDLVDGVFQPTAIWHEGVADKLGIPIAYLRRIHEQRTDLYDANVNGLLHGRNAKVRYDRAGDVTETLREAVPGDSRNFLVRTFRSDSDGGSGIARALLSDSYAPIDNLDVLLATLDGARQAKADVVVGRCNLTDRRMYVEIDAPEVTTYATALLRDYRSPFTGESGADNPTVWAGLLISNSEVGSGAFSLTPRMTIQVCRNGMTITKDAMRSIHLGSKMDEGVIRWGEDTQRKNLDLIIAKTRDAVSTFLDVDYMNRVIARMEAKAGAKVEQPAEAVKVVARKLAFTQDQADGILDHFIRGADTSIGGLMNAVTSYAQTVESADTAYDMEAAAVKVLDLAGSI